MPPACHGLRSRSNMDLVCFSRLISKHTATCNPWSLVTFCVETPEGAAERLKAETAPMLRLRPDGSRLTWRVAAMSGFADPSRAPKPFFITWDDPSMRPDKVWPWPQSLCCLVLHTACMLAEADRLWSECWKDDSWSCRIALCARAACSPVRCCSLHFEGRIVQRRAG